MYYKDFRVDAVVHTNNVWEITETITVDFQEPRHGIYRYIPSNTFIDQKLKTADGGEEEKRLSYSLDIDFVSVEGSEYSTDYDEDNAIFKMGSADYTVTGLHTYVLKYKITYPYDRNPDADFLFHTVLPADLEDEVKHFSFCVTFDKPIADYADGKLMVHSGAWGSKGNALGVKVKQTANTISGEASDIPASTGVTLYQMLNNGFYEGQEPNSPKPMNVCLLISLVLALCIALRIILLRRPLVTKQIEFYPPEGISSAEVGTIIDETVDPIDIGSLIPWFASQGYLTIRESSKNEEKTFSKKTKLEIKRVKGMPNDVPDYQRTFFEVLFPKGKSSVCLDEIDEQPEKMAKVNEQIKNLYKGNKGDENDTSHSHVNLSALLYIPLMLTTFFALLFSYPGSYCKFDLLIGVFCTWLAPFACGYIINFVLAAHRYKDSKTAKIVMTVIKVLLFIGCTVCLYVLLYEEDSFLEKSIFFVVSVGCFVLTEYVGRFSIETPYRVKMLGKILGLKEFIETAEKPRLESLLEDDPQYFYRILPYALVLGLSDKWAEQFKDITMEKPSWYTGSSDLSSFHFANCMTSNLVSSTTNAITTVSHDSSSVSYSGGGGGGFSGGGGGGGGGGSW